MTSKTQLQNPTCSLSNTRLNNTTAKPFYSKNDETHDMGF